MALIMVGWSPPKKLLVMLMQAKSDLPYYNTECDLRLSSRTLSQVLGVIDL
jgi:hypothetical protein